MCLVYLHGKLVKLVVIDNHALVFWSYRHTLVHVLFVIGRSKSFFARKYSEILNLRNHFFSDHAWVCLWEVCCIGLRNRVVCSGRCMILWKKITWCICTLTWIFAIVWNAVNKNIKPNPSSKILVNFRSILYTISAWFIQLCIEINFIYLFYLTDHYKCNENRFCFSLFLIIFFMVSLDAYANSYCVLHWTVCVFGDRLLLLLRCDNGIVKLTWPFLTHYQRCGFSYASLWYRAIYLFCYVHSFATFLWLFFFFFISFNEILLNIQTTLAAVSK